MSADLNRRNFLKGLLAGAAVTAVGIPAALASDEYAVASPVLNTPFPGSPGDMFMKINGVWRYVCHAMSIDVRASQQMIDFSHIGSMGQIHREALVREQEISIAGFFEEEGKDMVWGVFNNAEVVKTAVHLQSRGIARNTVYQFDGYMQGMQERYPRSEFPSVAMDFLPRGSTTITCDPISLD